jgi:lysophospholipase L1-like esterase
MPIKVKHEEKLLFIGDSITDCGRRSESAPLGHGYVKFFADMVAIREPAKKVRIINKGIDGDTVVGLKNRWYDDVVRNKPDWLLIKIGINDLHSTFAPNGIMPSLFREAYDDILCRTEQRLPECKVVLMEPFYMSTDRLTTSFRGEVLKLLPQYIRTVHDMSRKHRTRLVETHKMFQSLLRYHDPDVFCPDPVHPNCTGHLAIARAVYAALSK